MISRARQGLAALAALGLAAPALAQSGIEVQSLDALDPLEVGLPGAALPMTLWDGSTADTAGAALASLPGASDGAYDSPALRELARAVLVSGGYPPAGARGTEALAVARTDRLLAASGVMDAFDLLERTPNLNTTTQLSRQHAELAFAAGEFDRACYTTNALLEGRDTPYWLRARALCLAVDGQNAAAELTAELASGVAPDADFDRLLFALTLQQPLSGNPVRIETGLSYALSRLAPVEDAALVAPSGTAPAWLREFAAASPLPNFLYSSDPAADLERAATLDGVEREHLLISVLAQGEDRERAAAALSQLLDDAAAQDDLLAALQLYGAEVATLPQTAETLGDGVRFTLAAALAGDLRTARAWKNGLVDGPRAPVSVFEAALPAAGDDKPDAVPPLEPVVSEQPAWVPPSAADLVALDYALLLASGRIDRNASVAVYAAIQERFGAAVTADLLALQRLGAEVPSGLRDGLAAREDAVVPAQLLAMEEAFLFGAEAEAILLAIAALQKADETNILDIYPRVATQLGEADLGEAMLGILLERHVERAF